MTTDKLTTALIIPTLNAGKDNWEEILKSIKSQNYQPEIKIILDSGSKDNTVTLAEKYGFQIKHVKPGTFDHAGTRKWGIELVKDKVDIVIFMTQDALLVNKDSFDNLLSNYQDRHVALVYGRQLPRDKASLIESFGRIFNYPDTSCTRVLSDKDILGMKVAFCSNSFCSYRISSLIETNAFPDRSIIGEDYITAANLLMSGYKIRYEAMSKVKHSHDYNIYQEFKRYFDIGVFHNEYQEIINKLGIVEKSGSSYFKSELLYLFENSKIHLPLSILKTISKYIGYKIGKRHNKLSKKIKKKLSMHSFYFN